MATNRTTEKASRRPPQPRAEDEAAEARLRVERHRLRAADHRRGRADQPDRDARLRPPRPDREPRLHAVARRRRTIVAQPARLPDGQGVHLEGPAARAGQPSAATCATCSTSTAPTRRASCASRPSTPSDDKKIEEEAGAVQGAEAAGPGDALAEVRGRARTTWASASSTRARTRRSRRSTQVEGLEYRISSLHQADDAEEAARSPFTNGHGEADLTRASLLKHDSRSSRSPPSTRRRRPIPDDVDALRGRRPQAAVRRQGPPRDRRLPDEGQGRDLPGRRHGDAARRAAGCRPR